VAVTDLLAQELLVEVVHQTQVAVAVVVLLLVLAALV
jgi:hypothetical protein